MIAGYIRILPALAALALAACGGVADDHTGSVQSALKIPNTGFIPFPVFPDGRPAWDGTLVDLMAADAWAECEFGLFRDLEDDAPEADAYLNHLMGKMRSASCANNFNVPAVTDWYFSRAFHPECNVDPSTGTAATVSFEPQVNDIYSFGFDLQATDPDTLNLAYHESARERAVAAVNLCMAQRLRERMASADSLFASTEQQVELLEVIRQRAQLAMIQYGLLGLATAQDVPSDFVVSEPLQVVPALHNWGRAVLTSSRGAETFGQDFAAAIKLHIDSTREETELLVRSAAARNDTRNVSSPADLDWGTGSARQRLLRLLYGGDALNGFGGLTFPWGSGSSPFADQGAETFVSTSARAPEVRSLLGFGRAADTLYLKALPFASTDDSRIRIDLDKSAENLYRSVEAFIRRADCKRETPGDPCDITAVSSEIPSTSQFEQYRLWQRHRVTPSHATTLVGVLSEGMPRVKRPVSFDGPNHGGNAIKGALHFTGQHDLIEDVSAVLPGQSGAWYHIDPQFAARRYDNVVRAAQYMHARGIFLPNFFFYFLSGRTQGFAARWNGFVSDTTTTQTDSDNQALRELGAVPALTAVRSLILAGLEHDPSLSNSLYRAPLLGLDLITSAVGPRSFELRPSTNLVFSSSCGEYFLRGRQPAGCLILGHQGGNLWQASVITRPEDALHTLVDTTLNGQPVVPNGMEATAALDPNFRSFGGYTRANLQALETIPLTTANLVNGWERRTANVTTGDQGGTYLLKGEGSLANHYDVLADTIFVDGDWDFEGRNADGKYLAPGGFLGAVAQKAWSMLPYDWSKPSFDGLGLPVDWVPPYEGELLGDHPGTATVQFYLGKAQAAADEASAAVRAAVDNLLKEEADAVALAAAQKKAATIDNLEQQSLCGEKAAKCDTRMVALDLRSRISPIDQTPGPDGRTCSNTICQVLQEAVLRVVPKSVSVGAAVADRINQDAVPSFDDYQGGELQRLFIQQWTAVTTLIRFVSFDTRLQAIAKMAAVDAAAATLQAANNTAALLCDHRTLRAAWDAGYSFQVDIEDEQLFFFDENGYSGTITHKNDGTSWSMGPLIAAINACQQSKIQLAPAAAQAAAVVSDAWSWASGQLTQITQHVADVRTSMANISGGIQKTKIAKASAALEADLVADQLTTRLGLARRFHSYDIWRAQALLENARRLSVAARRAIEATFVVDLSDMHAPEAFVREPAQWADDVYAHDLNAPASVGLQTPAQIAGGIYPNRLSDYVHNLDLFVQGYAITRPTASAKADAEIISLPPPEQVKSIEVSGGQKVDVLAAESAAWSFYCQADAMWIEHPGATETPLVSRLAQACNGVGPTKARLRFNLDPWARQNGDVAQPAFSARHNVRWRRLAVNVVGTGVRDCSKSLDPLSCFTEPFVKFDLRHVGPATVTDFDGRWHVLGIPTGVVESGKALAAEIWLDPVANGWSAPMVGAVARSEFLNRSVGGAYELELKLTPDVRLDRIERIQLLTESDYWVKQD